MSLPVMLVWLFQVVQGLPYSFKNKKGVSSKDVDGLLEEAQYKHLRRKGNEVYFSQEEADAWAGSREKKVTHSTITRSP